MSFVKKETRRVRHILTEPRYGIRALPEGLTGLLRFPPEVLAELGWKDKDQIEVLVGTDEDTGWLALRKSGTFIPGNAKIHIEENGVGDFCSRHIVPEGCEIRVSMKAVDCRIDDGVFTFRPVF
ncbi:MULTISPECIES: hypothetical protein [unclassified Beijerinckia]|uniref:hypothetical protein n=1 Tax=unclassified Beijerinckia TaxID=2638183 RepID=UPI000895AE76|nr:MULTISPECIES: hypothetical protein [unclassified Beijerinckia]MDH7796368.1 hypothetical protein [Beijerinckia sp. GAS462]SEC42139.1 hypothetical protein SAMN05443249_2651 [Beijerinckia sp. 28-YEA-48]